MIKKKMQEFFKKNPTAPAPKAKPANKLAQSAGAMEIYNSPKMQQLREEEKQRKLDEKKGRMKKFFDSVKPFQKFPTNNKSKMSKDRYFA
jgi:hypothetical protein